MGNKAPTKYRERNYERVQFSSLRADNEARFTAMHDALEDAYYGSVNLDAEGEFIDRNADGWRDDVSSPVTFGGQTYDKEATRRLSKQLFDDIHGLIFDRLFQEMIIENNLRPPRDRIPLDEIDTPIVDDMGTPTGERKSTRTAERIAVQKAKGREIRNPTTI